MPRYLSSNCKCLRPTTITKQSNQTQNATFISPQITALWWLFLCFAILLAQNLHNFVCKRRTRFRQYFEWQQKEEWQNKKLVCMKLCAAKHYWCRSRYLCVCLLESWTPGESIVCWTHFVCLTSLHGLCHSRIGTQTHFFGPFYLWNGLLKDCQGHNGSMAWELSKIFLNNYNKLLTSKLRALIKKFCRQAVKMLLSSCQL